MAATTCPGAAHTDPRWRAAVSLAGLAALAALASESERSPFAAIDHHLTSLVARRRSAASIRAAHAISAAAEPVAVALPLAVASAIAARHRGWWAACEPSMTVLAGMAVRRDLSRLVARPRPPAAIWLIEPEGFSLPSKHTSLAALTAGACAAALGTDRLTSDTAVVVAAAGVGASRICLGVHWPTDVLAGWLFAAAWLDLLRVLPARARGSGRRHDAAVPDR